MRVNQAYGKRYEEDSFSEEPKKKYFIACEGERTEYQYFKGMMEFRTEIGIHPLIEIIPVVHEKNTSSNPLKIYNEANKAIREVQNFLEGDKLCIIVDRDKQTFTEPQYQMLLEAEKRQEIHFCVSNPCFEFWLLLHYSDASEYNTEALLENKKIGSRTQTEIYLMEKLGGTYSKKRLLFKIRYLDTIHTAIKNSKKYTTDTETLKNNLGTNIGLLIEEMLSE